MTYRASITHPSSPPFAPLLYSCPLAAYVSPCPCAHQSPLWRIEMHINTYMYYGSYPQPACSMPIGLLLLSLVQFLAILVCGASHRDPEDAVWLAPNGWQAGAPWMGCMMHNGWQAGAPRCTRYPPSRTRAPPHCASCIPSMDGRPLPSHPARPPVMPPQCAGPAPEHGLGIPRHPRACHASQGDAARLPVLHLQCPIPPLSYNKGMLPGCPSCTCGCAP